MKKRKIASIMLTAACMLTAVLPVSASNSTNSNFGFQLPVYNGLGVQPGAREKTDDTSCYVRYNDGPWDTWFVIFGTNNPVTYPDINTLTNCTLGEKAKVGLGEEREVRQYVYEWYYQYAYIGGSSQSYPEQYAIGVWSPDCVGSYPYAPTLY